MRRLGERLLWVVCKTAAVLWPHKEDLSWICLINFIVETNPDLVQVTMSTYFALVFS